MWEGNPYKMAVRRVPKPTIIDPTDAIVHVTSAAVCGSDLHIFHGILGSAEVPYGVGHEAVGYVAAIGDGVKFLKVGQRVLISDTVPSTLTPTQLPIASAFGLGKDFGDLPGCQAEWVRCPFADGTLVPVDDDDIDDRDLLTLTDIFATAWTGITSSGFQPGDTVVVFGAGPVGLLCAYGALLRGASKVVSVDHVHARLEKAKELGAIPVNLAKGDVAGAIRNIFPDGAKRVVDCVGEECVNESLKPDQSYIINTAIRIAAIRGGIAVIGVYNVQPDSKGVPCGHTVSPSMSINFPEAWIKTLRIESVLVDPEPLEANLLRLVTSRRAKPGFVFSGEYRIQDAQLAYERFDKKQETKVLFRFPWIDEQKEKGPCSHCGRD